MTQPSILAIDKSFHVRGGKVFRNLHELKSGLDSISEEDFQFHLKNGNNDFAEWIKHIFDNDKLASSLKKIKTKKGFIKKLEEFGI